MLRPNLRLALLPLLLAALAVGCADSAEDNTGMSTQGSGSEANKSASSGGFDDGSQTGGGGGGSSGGGTSSGGTSGGTSGGAAGGGMDAGAASDAASPGPGETGGGGDKGGAASDAGASAGPDAGGAASDAGPTPDVSGSPDKAPVCNVKDDTVLYLSADDSNSMAGATVARGLIEQGQHVYKGLRTYEFLNYYHFDYAPSTTGQLAVSAQLRKADGGAASKVLGGGGATAQVKGSEAYHLQIAVRAPDFSLETRRDVHLVLAVDTSSSMGWGPLGNTGLDRAQAACVALAGSLRKGDHVSVVTWGAKATTLLAHHAIKTKHDGELIAACGKIGAEGTTNLSEGLSTAYALAGKHFDNKQMNRVVLVSDGGSNVGEKDAELIAKWAKAADGKAITLMGVGVGDPWNYNDALMDTVTDAGKGAYVFFDDTNEADKTFGDAFLRHMEIAARDVQVQVTLPPSFAMQAFYGEQVSTNKDEVEPQHLAANDAMIFHQVVATCDPKWLADQGKDAKITVVANYIDPTTGKASQASYEAKLSDLLTGDALQLLKGDAVVAFAETLKALRKLSGKEAIAAIDDALAVVAEATKQLPKDPDLLEIQGLLTQHKQVFDKGQKDLYPTGGTGAKALTKACGGCIGKKGSTLDALTCALDLCDDKVLLSAEYTSPTQSTTKGTYAATSHYGAKTNDLAPKVGDAYAVMATGPALGTQHSKNMGGSAETDPFVGGTMYNAMELKLKLKAPKGAGGLRLNHVFFSQEYDEYVGSSYNDKFYIVIEAGSTNGGKPTVINYTACRDPDKHHDFVCSPGMQFCNPRQRYCYIAINTAASECCWLGGCPNGTAKTDISGTGFSCASAQGKDSANHGSSTGWMTTEWPIEPGEEFTLTFHVHDTGDGIYDSAVILDGLQFVGSVTPGTWSNVSL